MTDRASPSPNSSTVPGIVRDTFLWRRKNLSLATLLISTAIWMEMEMYQFNFATLPSYAAMLVVTSLFLLGNLNRLLGKEAPKLLKLEVSGKGVIEAPTSYAEESIRWLFQIGAKGDWLTFVGVVAALWSIPRIGHHFDLLTLLYQCLVSGLVVPPLAIRYQEKIEALKDAGKARCRRLYEVFDDKVIRNFGSKTGLEEIKEKRTE